MLIRAFCVDEGATIAGSVKEATDGVFENAILSVVIKYTDNVIIISILNDSAILSHPANLVFCCFIVLFSKNRKHQIEDISVAFIMPHCDAGRGNKSGK